MNPNTIADTLEAHIREAFRVSADDPGFHRSVDLFETGYVDSVGVIELLAFVQDRFDVEVPESALLSDRFATIEGMAEILAGLLGGAPHATGPAPGEADAGLPEGARRDDAALDRAA